MGSLSQDFMSSYHDHSTILVQDGEWMSHPLHSTYVHKIIPMNNWEVQLFKGIILVVGGEDKYGLRCEEVMKIG